MNNIKEFIKLLNNVTERPAIYGIESIEELDVFILGYLIASETEKRAEISDLMNSFNEYVKNDMPIEKDNTNFKWQRRIRFYSAGRVQSVALFKTLFDKFLESNYFLNINESK